MSYPLQIYRLKIASGNLRRWARDTPFGVSTTDHTCPSISKLCVSFDRTLSLRHFPSAGTLKCTMQKMESTGLVLSLCPTAHPDSRDRKNPVA